MKKVLLTLIAAMLLCGPVFAEVITYEIDPVEVVSPDDGAIIYAGIYFVTEQIKITASDGYFEGTGDEKKFISVDETSVIFQNTLDDESTTDIDESSTDYDDFIALFKIDTEKLKLAAEIVKAKAAESESE